MTRLSWAVAPVPARMPETLAAATGESVPVCRVLAARGITTPEGVRTFLEGGLADLADPMLLPDMPAAVAALQDALEHRRRIMVHGDYDADGITSAALLTLALLHLGADVFYYIPHRMVQGYGVTLDSVTHAVAQGASLLITADCGTGAVEAVTAANQAGIVTIVTDHHESGEVVAPALAVINWKRRESRYPFSGLCGAGTALALMRALYQRLGRDDWKQFVDLAALGTIADVVPLVGENRILVKAGLKQMEVSPRPGVAALLAAARLAGKPLGVEEMAWQIIPRLNAMGRLGHADESVRILMEEDPAAAAAAAVTLDHVNKERQRLVAALRADVDRLLQAEPHHLDHPVLVLASDAWHPGLIGIVASRLAEEHHRPVFLISLQSGVGRGSARSRNGFHITDALAACEDLLDAYGGHAKAGGFSIQPARVQALQARLAAFDPAGAAAREPIPVDLVLPLSALDVALARDLDRLAPFGSGHPRPLIALQHVEIVQTRRVGARGAHVKLTLAQQGTRREGIAFRQGELAGELLPHLFLYDLLGFVEEDHWAGGDQVQFQVKHMIPPDPAVVTLLSAADRPAHQSGGFPSVPTEGKRASTAPQVLDGRSVRDPGRYLDQVAAHSTGGVVLVRGPAGAAEWAGIACRPGMTVGRLQVRDAHGPIHPGGQDLVVVDPAPDGAALAAWCAGVERVHVVCTAQGMAAAQRYWSQVAPDRDTLAHLYRRLKRQAGDGGPTPGDPEGLGALLDIPAALAGRMLEIFQELDFVAPEARGEGCRLQAGRRRDLEESTVFRTWSARRAAFAALADALQAPTLEALARTLAEPVMA